MKFASIDSVNFYGDYIDVAVSDEGRAYVSVSQITGYLGLDYEMIISMFDNDPRVEMSFIDGQAIVDIIKLNGFLMLLPFNEVPEEFKDDLLKYQVECFEALHDYWIHGVALNRREHPFDINSKFTDERMISRKNLTDAVQAYVKMSGGDTPDGLRSGELFEKVLSECYKIVGLEPKHEYEKLTGAEAKYLAWVENVFAKVINKFALWQQTYEDVIAEAQEHVENHLRETAYAWIAMADAMPSTVYSS